jgi:ABC-type antimicrobial peptide transport system permease subunit
VAAQSRFLRSAAFYVRTGSDPAALHPALRSQVAKLDASMPVYEMKTLERQLDETLTAERLIAALSSAFGVLATLLAAIGLYGVMAFVVARRTREIGLRMALGAQRGSVIWLVMKDVVVLLAIGLLIGIPCAYGLSSYVSSQLFGVEPTDLWTAAAALLVLSTVALAAGFLPARRASTVDPIQALRYE